MGERFAITDGGTTTPAGTTVVATTRVVRPGEQRLQDARLEG
jgi:hypothetical protein